MPETRNSLGSLSPRLPIKDETQSRAWELTGDHQESQNSSSRRPSRNRLVSPQQLYKLLFRERKKPRSWCLGLKIWGPSLLRRPKPEPSNGSKLETAGQHWAPKGMFLILPRLRMIPSLLETGFPTDKHKQSRDKITKHSLHMYQSKKIKSK